MLLYYCYPKHITEAGSSAEQSGLIISLSLLEKIVCFINGCCLPRVFLQKQNNAALLLFLCQYKVYFHRDIKEKEVFFIIYFISIIKSQLK